MEKTIKVFYKDKENQERVAEFSKSEWRFIQELAYRPFKFYQNWQHEENDGMSYHYWSKLWNTVRIDASEYNLRDLPPFYFIAAVENEIGRHTSHLQDTKGKIPLDYIDSLNFLLKRIEQDAFNPSILCGKTKEYYNNPSNYKGFDYSKIIFTMDKEKDFPFNVGSLDIH